MTSLGFRFYLKWMRGLLKNIKSDFDELFIHLAYAPAMLKGCGRFLTYYVSWVAKCQLNDLHYIWNSFTRDHKGLLIKLVLNIFSEIFSHNWQRVHRNFLKISNFYTQISSLKWGKHTPSFFGDNGRDKLRNQKLWYKFFHNDKVSEFVPEYHYGSKWD